MRLIKTISGFVLILRISRYRRGIIGKGIASLKEAASALKKTLLKTLIISYPSKEVMVYILSDTIFIRNLMIVLPCLYAGKRLPICCKQVSGKRDDLLCCACISSGIYGIINTRYVSRIQV